jgi:salicylate hydroxylase
LSDSERPAIIAGGGIAGLSAALALAQIGLSVRVLERAEIFDEFGAGLQLTPNATGILRQLGVLERLESSALKPQAISIRRGHDGRELSRLPLAQAEQRWGAPYYVAHRADLHRVLLERAAAQPRITLSRQCTVLDYEQDHTGVTVKTSSQSGVHHLAPDTLRGCLLLGADGLRSNVRRRLLADGEPRFAARSAWRGLINASRVTASARLPEITLWLGRRAHLVHYPIRAGSLINVVAVVDDDWQGVDPAQRLSGTPPPSFAEPGDAHLLACRFAGWNPIARTLLEAVGSWRKWPLFERDPPRRLAEGLVALVGDAAHPVLPYLAQGAAQAIEDAHVLARLLADSGDMASALRSYARTRHRRIAKIGLRARQLGHIYHLARPAALARDIAIRLLGPEKMLARYDWLFTLN